MEDRPVVVNTDVVKGERRPGQALSLDLNAQ